MKNKILFLLIVISQFSYGQKVKPVKEFSGWSIQTVPKVDLGSDVKINSATINSPMSPLSYDDLLKFKSKTIGNNAEKKEKYLKKAGEDTLAVWAEKYLVLDREPFRRKGKDQYADILTTFTTSEFSVENINFDLDYSNPESVVCILNTTGTLIVTTNQGDVLLDTPIKYINRFQNANSNELKLKDLGSKYFSEKKSVEKKREMLENKMSRIEGIVLEDLVLEAQDVLKVNFLRSREDYQCAVYGIKDKQYEALNKTAENVKDVIGSIGAMSKKKRRTVKQVEPILKEALLVWNKVIKESSNPEIQKYMNANIVLVSLILGDLDSSKKHFDKIPEAKNIDSSGIMSGSFKFYVKELSKAIKVKEKYGDFAQTFENN